MPLVVLVLALLTSLAVCVVGHVMFTYQWLHEYQRVVGHVMFTYQWLHEYQCVVGHVMFTYQWLHEYQCMSKVMARVLHLSTPP